MNARNIQLAWRAKRHGARWALRIILEARKAGVPISLAFALVDQESGFRNIFGHDPSIFKGAGTVTRRKYAAYKKLRGPKGAGGMQGVGPCQLTWYSTQDAADRLGGCHIPRYNISQAMFTLGTLIAAHGRRDGCRRYNGSGPAAERYADRLLLRQRLWHQRLRGR